MALEVVVCCPAAADAAGGAKVLDGIGKELQLDEFALEPSRMVLHDYGNVSSSTTWYTLGYVESVRGAKKGDRLLQIGVGSGIKCGVNVWQAVRDIHDVQDAWVRGRLAIAIVSVLSCFCIDSCCCTGACMVSWAGFVLASAS